MISERNVANVLITKDVNTTVAAGANIEAELAGMSTGELVVLTPGGNIVDSAATLPAEFKLAVKLSSGKLQYSDIIKGKNVKSIHAYRTAAAVQQVDYIGYNGTSGSLEALNNNIYTVRLYMIPTDIAGFAQQKVKRGVYKSDASATQGEIAAGLASSLITNLSKEPETIKYGTNNVKVERVASAASVATSAGAITFTKGSKFVSWPEDGNNNDAGKYNADGSSVAVGDYIRVGHATDTTYPVYQVVGITGSANTTIVLELDIPYQGASATVAAANCGIATAAAVAAGSLGIKLTGSTYSFDPPKFGYYLPRWKTNLQDCGTTTVTNSTVAAEGVGTYEQVAYAEQQFQGNEGMWYRAMVPYPTYRKEANSTKTYSIITIDFEDDMTTTLGSSEKSLKQIYIACERPCTGTSLTDANTGFVIALERVVSQWGCANNTDLSTEVAA